MSPRARLMNLATVIFLLTAASATWAQGSPSDARSSHDLPLSIPPTEGNGSTSCECGPPQFLDLFAAGPKNESAPEVVAWTKRTLARATIQELGTDKAALIGYCQVAEKCSERAVVALKTIQQIIDERLVDRSQHRPLAARIPPSTASSLGNTLRETQLLPIYGGKFVAFVEAWRGSYEDLADAVRRKLRGADRPTVEYVDAALEGACHDHSTCDNAIAVAQVEVRHLISDDEIERQHHDLGFGYVMVLAGALLGVLGSLVSVIIMAVEGRKTSAKLVMLLDRMTQSRDSTVTGPTMGPEDQSP